MQFVPIAPLVREAGSPGLTPAGAEGTTCLVLSPAAAPSTDSNNNAGTLGKGGRRGQKRALPAQSPEQAALRSPMRGGRHPKAGKNVLRRNERERNRVKQVNQGFDVLRQHVPNGAKNKKMSKVDTLKGAVDYIKYLQEVLDSDSPLDIAPFTMEFSSSEGEDGQYASGGEYGENVAPPPAYSEPLPGQGLPHHHQQQQQEQDGPFSPRYPTPSAGLPSPGGYSTDGSQGSEHYSDPCPEQAPMSPEDQQLLEFASWLTFQS